MAGYERGKDGAERARPVVLRLQLAGVAAFAGAAVRLQVRARGVSHRVARRARALEEPWLRLPLERNVQARLHGKAR